MSKAMKGKRKEERRKGIAGDGVKGPKYNVYYPKHVYWVILIFLLGRLPQT